MTRTIKTILATTVVVLILVVAVAARGSQTWSALDARNAALVEANRYVQQLEARVNAFDAKEAALIEAERYVQQLEARLEAYHEGQR
jgi:hypothetical protein